MGYKDQTLVGTVEDVTQCYPPHYIVGPVSAEIPNTILTKDTELATVTIEEVSTEYMYSNPQELFNLSCPNKMWRNPVNYQQISYPTWKMASLRQRQLETGQEFTEDDIIYKDWKQDSKMAVTILRVLIRSKARGMTRVGITFSIQDNENKNVNLPITEMKENLFANDTKHAFCFSKIDPSKEGWGDIDCEIRAVPSKTSQISTAGYSAGNDYGGYSGGVTTSTSTGTYG